MSEFITETISRVEYEDILFRAIEDCRRARVYGDLARYSEAVMALLDTLSPDIRGEIDPIYDEIKAEMEVKVKEIYEELKTMATPPYTPLDQAAYYQNRVLTVEREGVDRLYREIIKVLDKNGMLTKRRELEGLKRGRLE